MFKNLLESKHYKDSVSRSYYAIFTAVRALLVTKRLDSAKHPGVIFLFNQRFVKSGLIYDRVGKLLERAKLYRKHADYGYFYIVSSKEAAVQIEPAKQFIKKINMPHAKAQKEPVVFEKVKYAYDDGALPFSLLLGSSQILLLKRIRGTLAGRVSLFEPWSLTIAQRLIPQK